MRRLVASKKAKKIVKVSNAVSYVSMRVRAIYEIAMPHLTEFSTTSKGEMDPIR